LQIFWLSSGIGTKTTGGFRTSCTLQAHGTRSMTLPNKGEQDMRSDLIFGALTHVTNRYQLCQLAAKATRKLHKPNTRLQDTTNEVLDRFKDTVPMDEGAEQPVEKISRGDHRERRAA
jgi:hypothetical protein